MIFNILTELTVTTIFNIFNTPKRNGTPCSSYSSVFPNPPNYRQPLNHILSLDWLAGGHDYKRDHYVLLGVQTSSRTIRIREAKVVAWECLPCRDGKSRGQGRLLVCGSAQGQGGAIGVAVPSTPDPRASRRNTLRSWGPAVATRPLTHLPCQP